MSRTIAMAACLAVLAFAPAAAAAAENPLFARCDGYGAPDKAADGMIGVGFLGKPMVYGMQTRATPLRGRAGVAACDAALADAVLKPDFWLRRASLLNARALHRLEAGDTAGALADLDLAQAAVQQPDEVFYRRSLGLSLDLTRAYALRTSGDAARGEALAIKVWRERPWNLEVVTSALGALGPASLEDRNLPLFRDFARLEPRALDNVFLRAFRTGHWDEATALFPQLGSPLSRAEAYTGSDYDYLDPMVVEPYWAKRSGMMAVALLAQGRDTEARAVMEAARKRIVDDTKDPKRPPEIPTDNGANKRSFRYVAPTAEEVSRAKQAMAAYDNKVAENHRIAAAANRGLEGWQAVLTELAAARTEPADAVLARVRNTPAMDPGEAQAFLDILIARPDTAALRPDLMAEKAKRAGPLRSQDFDLTPSQLFDTLPETESALLLTPFRGRLLEFGYTVSSPKRLRDGRRSDPGVLMVSFHGNASRRAMVEEMALLKAADLARAAGLHGFIVLDRSDTLWVDSSNTVTREGSQNGWECNVYFLPVDPAALPQTYRGTPWRVMDADAIWAALSPIYIPPGS